MAQPIHCDYTGCPAMADVLVSRIANGETLAWCDPHFLAMSVAIVEAAGAAEAEAADAEALARLGEAQPDEPTRHPDPLAEWPDGSGPDAGPAEFPTSGDASGAGAQLPEPPTKPAGGRKRRGVARETTDGAAAAPGPNLGPSDDPGEPATLPA